MIVAMHYAITRALAAALSFGLSAQLPGVAVVAVALLWSMIAVLVAPASLDLWWSSLFFEAALGLWVGLCAATPIVAARLGAAFGDEPLAAPYSTLGALFAGATLFAAGADHLLIRAFAQSFVGVPAGEAHLALQGPAALIGLLQVTLRASLQIGAVGVVALLLADLASSLLARLFPGQSVALPRQPMKLLGLYVSLAAISYVILQTSQEALSLLSK